MRMPVIDLWFQGDEIRVETVITPQVFGEQLSIRFAEVMTVDRLTVDGKPIPYEVTPAKAQFQPPLQMIRLPSGLQGDIVLAYHGRPGGWCNEILPEHKTLSGYSAWHPTLFVDGDSVKEDTIVRVHGIEDHIVVKGTYDTVGKTWLYGGEGYDRFNIIALRRDAFHSFDNEDVSVYVCHERELGAAKKSFAIVNDVLSFYQNDLYGNFPIDIGHMDIVSVSHEKNSGAYFRKGLIFATQLSEDPVAMMSLCSHEIAHAWATGADTSSWHDWLNETMAEWSSYLFALHAGMFDCIEESIANHRKYAEGAPPIRTPDGSRPDTGVHNRGTLLYYELYKEYGVDTVRSLLETFVKLPLKTTEHYIHALRANIGDTIADRIEAELDRT